MAISLQHRLMRKRRFGLSNSGIVDLDELSLRMIEELLRKPRAKYKEIGALTGHDQRTVARRIGELEAAGILTPSVEIDWRSLGMDVSALVGLTTARNQKASTLLHEYLQNDPRIVDAYETVGSSQFFLRILGGDIFSVRQTVLRDLDPLAGDMATSLVAKVIKSKDYFPLVRHIREVKFPKSRSLG